MWRGEVDVFVGLGSNLPLGQQSPEATLRWALQELAQQSVWHVQQVSSLYRSTAWQADGPDYINAVAQLRTRLTAPEVLTRLQAIEHQALRQRPYQHAPRTLDLDLLLYGDGRIQSAALTVPHPRMHERAFVLRPLTEIAPERVSRAWLEAVQAQDARLFAPPPALDAPISGARK
jgi:2-amino-4-hydroxy-6-hydroxymethyldihydropteridine diphosphokinase